MFKKHVIKELSAYCHGELPIEDARRVAEHLLGCQHCRNEFEEIKLGAQLIGYLPSASAPASLWPRKLPPCDGLTPSLIGAGVGIRCGRLERRRQR